MTKDELKREIRKLQNKCKSDCRALRVKYALEHNPIKIGDIIEHTNSYPHSKILVKTIEVPDYGDFGIPDCLYKGYSIDNNGKIYDGINNELIIKTIYQQDVNFINGTNYTYIKK